MWINMVIPINMIQIRNDIYYQSYSIERWIPQEELLFFVNIEKIVFIISHRRLYLCPSSKFFKFLPLSLSSLTPTFFPISI